MAWDQNAASWTATELLADVRRVAQLPATSTDFTDAVLYREATDVLWSFAGWAMQQAGEGRLSALFNRPVSALLSSDYRASGECELPPLAIADTVESVAWLNANGTNETRLQRIDHAVQSDYDRPDASGSPRAYALIGARLRLYPKPDQGGTIRVVYQRRHPHLIADTTTNVGTVTGIQTQPNQPTQTNLIVTTPAMSVQPNDLVDLISRDSPYRPVFTSVRLQIAPYVNAGFTVVTVELPNSAIGSLNIQNTRLVRSGQTPFVHYPLELRAAITEKIAANLMRRYGDLSNAQASEQAALQELGRVVTMLSPRVKRDRPKAVNPYSHLRSGLRAGWRPR